MAKVLAVDIGGTGIKMGLVDTKGRTSRLHQFPTPRDDYRQLPEQLMAQIDAHYLEQFTGIAVSSTGIVNPKDRSIGWQSPLYDAFGTTLIAQLEARYDCFVSVENDGNCAALAENWIGAGKDCRSIITIVLGTSVGGAVVVDGRILHGAHNIGGEFGYLLFPDPKKGWELWSLVGSTRALIEQLTEQKGLEKGALTGHQITELLEQKDSVTESAVDSFIEKLAVGCYSLQYAIDPEKILIGGGISKAAYLLPRLQEKIAAIAAKIPSNVLLPQVEACRFGNESNLIGAAVDWWQKQELSLAETAE